MGEYDVLDNSGRKVGTFRPSSDSGCAGTLLLILIPIGLLIACVWGLASYFVHPTLSNWVDYDAKDAHVSGHTGPGDMVGTDGSHSIKLYPGASLEFDVSVPSDDQYVLNFTFNGSLDDIQVTVNGIEETIGAYAVGDELVMHLNKGTSIIKVFNKGSNEIDMLAVSIKTQ